VGRVGGGADAAGQEHYPGLLSRHCDAAGPLLVASEVALSEGAEAAEIAEGHVEGLVTAQQLSIPVPEGADAREWCGAHGFLPCVIVDTPHLELEPLDST